MDSDANAHARNATKRQMNARKSDGRTERIGPIGSFSFLFLKSCRRHRRIERSP